VTKNYPHGDSNPGYWAEKPPLRLPKNSIFPEEYADFSGSMAICNPLQRIAFFRGKERYFDEGSVSQNGKYRFDSSPVFQHPTSTSARAISMADARNAATPMATFKITVGGAQGLQKLVTEVLKARRRPSRAGHRVRHAPSEPFTISKHGLAAP
jgi:hypothetical protein